MKYRAEIDGLRALAVVPVILFHAGFELFSGGFVGVDVFFVISGYLITTILIEDLENKRFSLVSFYERRARRILPALFFVMLVCIPFAWMWMLPNQMKDFSQSLVAVSLFASNVLFWRESGYFDAAAEEKPLLHTWSLAVEEQYYVLFPIFLFLAWRYGKNRVFWMIVAMASISLLLSEWGWRNKATANFYLAPTRAWELFAGSIAAFIVQKNGVRKNNFLALLGLAAITFSIFAYDESTPFPSLYALVPVLGVVLLILYADKDTLTAKLLGTKALVGFGLISYSAYLWHQPLFAFARIKSAAEPSFLLMSTLAIGSLALAYFSWRYIETPFRSSNIVNSKRLIVLTLAGFVFFIGIGLNGNFNDNLFENYFLETRLTKKEKSDYIRYKAETDYDMYLYQRSNVDCHHWQKSFDEDLVRIIKKCNSNGQKVVLIVGGSHAMNLYNVLSIAMPETSIIGISQGYCRLSDWKDFCKPEKFFEFIKMHSESFDKVIYHQTGIDLKTNESKFRNLTDNLKLLNKKLGAKLEFWEPWEEGRTNYIDIITKKASHIPQSLVTGFQELDANLEGFSSEEGISYFSLYKLFLPYQVNFVEGGCLLYRDHNHLSRCAEELFADELNNELSVAVLK